MNRTIYDFYIKFLKSFFYLAPHEGVDIMAEDWDYLIILDACRYDDFKNVNHIKGQLDHRISKGSNTHEWLKKNFYEENDLIYISSNPYISNQEISGFRGTDYFHHIENVWLDDWDEAKDTVPPEKVTDATLRTLKEFPDHRMIVHYIQPHGPWIGDTEISIEVQDLPESLQHGDGTDDRWNIDTMVWDKVIRGELDIKRLRQATRDNLRLVLKEVERLINYLDGTIVVTSDHGEAFGEMGVYSHYRSLYIEPLVKVPWFTKRKNSSKKIPEKFSEQGNSSDQPDETVTQERLKGLGYL
jgi:arylsulfatase A-like enzyme